MRFTMTYMTIAMSLLLAGSATANAGIFKPKRPGGTGWSVDQGRPPIMHTNQDGPMGSTLPGDDWSDISAAGAAPDRGTVGKPDLLDTIFSAMASSPAIDGGVLHGPGTGSTLTPPVRIDVDLSGPMVGGAPVPAPGVLGLIGVAALAGRGRRRA